jgi:cysteine desulfurase family protein (TIGR01976 family)
MLDYLYHHNANTEWNYPTSAETDEAIADAREALGDFLNASPDEIMFGANMTTLTFHLSRAIGRTLSKGDEIVVTELDHHANVDPWRQLARDRDLCVRTVKMIPETGQLDWEDLERALNGKTKLVAMGAASNALGTINDVTRATRMAHDAGALMFVDAVHYAPHNLVDVKAIGCDFLGCSAYKFYGPHIGVMFGRHGLLESLDFPKLVPAHDNAPDRGETGTLNHEGIVGAGAAVDFFASLSQVDGTRRERLESTLSDGHARGEVLFAKLWSGLKAIDGVSVYGSPPGSKRTPTIAFTLRGKSSRDVAGELADAGVFVSHGDFYATTVVERLGLTEGGLVRAGCAIYTSDSEVERFVEGVRRICHPEADDHGPV